MNKDVHITFLSDNECEPNKHQYKRQQQIGDDAYRVIAFYVDTNFLRNAGAQRLSRAGKSLPFCVLQQG